MALLNITTRETAITAPDTNEATEESTNAGAALTNAQLDQNFINIKNLVDANAARMNTALNADGSIKDLAISADDLADNSVDYSKLKSIHYVVATGAVNTMLVTVGTDTASDLASLDAGMLFFVKANLANTGAVTLTVSNSSGQLGGGAKSVLKRKDQALTSGDIKADQVVAVLYDGTVFQVINPTSDINIGLVDLANQDVGQLISFDSSKAPAIVNAGTEGHILTANATGNAPSFQSGSGLGMKLLIYSETVVSLTQATPGEGAQTGQEDISSIIIPADHGFSDVMIEIDYKGTANQEYIVWQLLVGGASKRTWKPMIISTPTIEKGEVTTGTWIGTAPVGTDAQRTALFRKAMSQGSSEYYGIALYGFRVWGLNYAPA